MAIIGMFLQEGLVGSAGGVCALYTASPLRTFDNEPGVLAPVGFCDPAGFTADGNYEDFDSRYQTEQTSGHSSACSSRRASLALPVALVPCTRRLRCARSITSLAFWRQWVSVILLASRLVETTRISPATARRSGRHGRHRHVPTRGPHWLCLGCLCLVPGISVARVR